MTNNKHIFLLLAAALLTLADFYLRVVSGDPAYSYFVSSASDARKKVYFTDSKSDADIVIYYTRTKSEACWQNRSKSGKMD